MSAADGPGRRHRPVLTAGEARLKKGNVLAGTVPVLIYDDDCEFCRRWARRFRRWTRNDGLLLVPLQHDGAAEMSGRSRPELLAAMHVITPGGAVVAGAAAVREILHLVPGGWLPRMVFRLPGAMRIADRTYGWVAARRQRLGCGGEHCAAPMARGRRSG